MFGETELVPVFLLNEHGVIVKCNMQAGLLVGLAMHDVEGKHYSDFVIPYDLQYNVLSQSNSYFIADFKRNNQSPATVFCIANKIVKNDSTYYFMMIYDISVKKTSLNSAKIKRIKLLTASIAHEYNNILTGITGFLSMLREQNPNMFVNEEFLLNAESGVRRAKELTRQIQAFSREKPYFSAPSGREKSSVAPRKHPKQPEDNGKVLLVTDDKLVAQTTRGMLHVLGYSTDLVSDGQSAVTLFRNSVIDNSPYRIVVMDLTLRGGITGPEALTLLQKIDPGVVAVVTSGYTGNEVMLNYREFGFRGALPKPYTVRQLYEALERAVAGTDPKE